MQTNRTTVATAIAALALWTAGCDSSDPEPADINGRWEDTFIFEEVPVLISINLQEGSENSVSGSGNFSFIDQSLPFTVRGTYAHPSISLSLQNANLRLRSAIDGTVSQNRTTITGRLTDATFDEAITLRKD